jgi:hypothetical protein
MLDRVDTEVERLGETLVGVDHQIANGSRAALKPWNDFAAAGHAEGNLLVAATDLRGDGPPPVCGAISAVHRGPGRSRPSP